MKKCGSKTRNPGHYPEKGVTHEYIHPVIAYSNRGNEPYRYNSAALQGFVRAKRKDSKNPGYNWVKTYADIKDEGKGSWVPSLSYIFGKATRPEGDKVVVTIPEWVIPGHDDSHKNVERWLITSSSQHRQQGFAPPDSAEAKKHWEREKVFTDTQDFIMQLDKDNGIEPWAPKFDTCVSSGFQQGGFSQGGFSEGGFQQGPFELAKQ